MSCPVCELDLQELNELQKTEHVESHFRSAQITDDVIVIADDDDDNVQCPYPGCGTILLCDSLADHLYAHSLEQDSLFQDQTHIADLSNEYEGVITRVFTGIPTILELQQTIEKAWQEGFDPKGHQELNGKVVGTKKWIGTTEVVALLRYLSIRAEVVDFTKPSGNRSTHPKLFQWVKDYFTKTKLKQQSASTDQTKLPSSSSMATSGSTTQSSHSASSGSSSTQSSSSSSKLREPDKKRIKLGNGEAAVASIIDDVDSLTLPPLYLQHQGHSRTIVGLEQSCRDQNKMFLLLLDPLKQKKFMLKIFTQSCGTTIQRNMRRSIPQETREQYEIVFVDGLLSKEERKAAKIVRVYQRFD